MPEDREVIQAHVGFVRERLYPEIQIDRFPDARRMISRFEGIIADWKSGKVPDATGIITAVNEIVVAIKLLRVPLTAHFQMVYEPRVTLTGQSIDLLLTSAEERYYFDIKTIRPVSPKDTKLEWEKYGRLRQLFPANADLILAENWMGAEF
jgi:hypothetical protein